MRQRYRPVRGAPGNRAEAMVATAPPSSGSATGLLATWPATPSWDGKFAGQVWDAPMTARRLACERLNLDHYYLFFQIEIGLEIS